MKRILPILLSLSILSGCIQKESQPDLDRGSRYIEGILHPAQISIARRGTHMLFRETGEKLFVESTLQDLQIFEGKRIGIFGVLSDNIDPGDLPIFQAQEITLLEEESRAWTIEDIVSFTVPIGWKGVREGTDLTFVYKEFEKPILSVFIEEEPTLPDGIPIVIDGKKAVRIVHEDTHAEDVSITIVNGRITFLFSPPEEDSQDLHPDFLRLLQTIDILSAPPPSHEMPPHATGSTVNRPCGGPAGILCPEGHYCEITDTEQFIGLCQSLSDG